MARAIAFLFCTLFLLGCGPKPLIFYDGRHRDISEIAVVDNHWGHDWNPTTPVVTPIINAAYPIDDQYEYPALSGINEMKAVRLRQACRIVDNKPSENCLELKDGVSVGLVGGFDKAPLHFKPGRYMFGVEPLSDGLSKWIDQPRLAIFDVDLVAGHEYSLGWIGRITEATDYTFLSETTRTQLSWKFAIVMIDVNEKRFVYQSKKEL